MLCQFHTVAGLSVWCVRFVRSVYDVCVCGTQWSSAMLSRSSTALIMAVNKSRFPCQTNGLSNTERKWEGEGKGGKGTEEGSERGREGREGRERGREGGKE